MKRKQTIIAVTLIFLLVSERSWSQNSGPQSVNEQKTKKMETQTIEIETNEKNKAVVRNLFEQIINKRKTALLKDFISDEYVGIRGIKGHEGFLEPLKPLIAAFPDIEWKIEDIMGEGDKVMLRWKWQGTHKAQFTHYPASGKTVTNDGFATYELKNGKITRTVFLTDRLGFLEQLGGTVSYRGANKDRVQFIDRFTVPAAAKEAFFERVRISREMLKKLPGFLEDAAYQYTDDSGNLVFLSVTQWASIDAMNKAKEVVQAEYKKQGFDAAEMFKRLNINLERHLFTEFE